MKKIEREYIAGQDLNNLELHWWNENAQIVSKVWEMQNAISWTARKHYLNNAKSYFKQGNKPVTILELGCGSGWVGQFIAGSDINIIGTDFSESQILLAQENARNKGLDKFCKYVVSDSGKLPDAIKDVDGILFHAFLHHLDGSELERLLTSLIKQLKPGAKVWIYEPAFYRPASCGGSKPSYPAAVSLKITNFIVSALHLIYYKFNLIDQTISVPFANLMKQSADNDWYLSPKEVPFDVDAFSDRLENYVVINKSYWATIYLIGWVYESNLLKNTFFRRLVNITLLPFFAFTDHMLAKEANYLKTALVPPVYAFHVWEGIIKE